MPAGRATPARPPAASAAEPLPQRRRRVLEDLRRARSRRQRVAIVTANVGEVLGLGVEPDGRLRAVPGKRDYARVGGMMKQYGDEQVWVVACRVAGNAVEGDPLDYLEACLREQESRQARRREGGHDDRKRRRERDDYPADPDGYGDGYEV